MVDRIEYKFDQLKVENSEVGNSFGDYVIDRQDGKVGKVREKQFVLLLQSQVSFSIGLTKISIKETEDATFLMDHPNNQSKSNMVGVHFPFGHLLDH